MPPLQYDVIGSDDRRIERHVSHEFAVSLANHIVQTTGETIRIVAEDGSNTETIEAVYDPADVTPPAGDDGAAEAKGVPGNSKDAQKAVAQMSLADLDKIEGEERAGVVKAIAKRRAWLDSEAAKAAEATGDDGAGSTSGTEPGDAQ